MPLKYFIHPETGKKLLITDCLSKGLLSEYYPLSYLHSCESDREWKGTTSTTQLMSGLREGYLKIFCDYATDPDSRAYAIIGTRGHARLEDNTPEGIRTETESGNEEITGIIDLIEPQYPDELLWMIDYKVVGSYTIRRALGLVKRTRPLIVNGEPVLYKSSGKWGKAGDPKTETYWITDENYAELRKYILQLNKYRMDYETAKNVVISKLKVFFVVRDGGLIATLNSGISRSTYYIEIPFIDNSEVEEYFGTRNKSFLKYVKTCEGHITGLKDKPKLSKVIENMPPVCTDEECWEGRKCKKYCDVAEFCKLKDDNSYLRGEVYESL